MSRSTCWSYLAFSMALISYVMHRDISANIFLATLFIIQGLKAAQDPHTHHQDRIGITLIILASGITLFAAWCLIQGVDLGRPSPFRTRIN